MRDKKINSFKMKIELNDQLLNDASSVEGWEKRDCFAILSKFLEGRTEDRVCALYGLRRTGKTTLLRQAALDIIKHDRGQAAYIKVNPENTMADLIDDLEILLDLGYKYVFIDEATLMENFIRMSSVLPDFFAAQGMKIVLSGTDSLGFWLAEGNELYDRVLTIHTTFIPFREHSRLLGVNDVDEYIRYGGTLRVGETAFDDPEAIAPDASFRDDESTRRYIDTAIARNIQNSLQYCRYGGYFRDLRDLYEYDELTNVINRIVEDINHKFLIKVISEDFKSHDFGSAADLLEKERNPALKTRPMKNLNKDDITKRLMNLLDIRNAPDLKVEINEQHVMQITSYLERLDLIIRCPIATATNKQITESEKILFTQPGMRFCQAQALVHSVMQDPYFEKLGHKVQDLITNRILDDVRGRMLEDIVLLETFKAMPSTIEVRKLLLDRGEVDMVVYDNEESCCDVFEIKHSTKAVERQARHLVSEETEEFLNLKYGKIRYRCVIYRGENGVAENGVIYCNANEYLLRLGDWKSGNNHLLKEISLENRHIEFDSPRIHQHYSLNAASHDADRMADVQREEVDWNVPDKSQPEH